LRNCPRLSSPFFLSPLLFFQLALNPIVTSYEFENATRRRVLCGIRRSVPTRDYRTRRKCGGKKRVVRVVLEARRSLPPREARDCRLVAFTKLFFRTVACNAIPCCFSFRCICVKVAKSILIIDFADIRPKHTFYLRFHGYSL